MCCFLTDKSADGMTELRVLGFLPDGVISRQRYSPDNKLRLQSLANSREKIAELIIPPSDVSSEKIWGNSGHRYPTH